jgi:cell division protein FtsB
VYYQEEIKSLEEEMKELSSDPEQLEKFVREKYLFKKRGEDIFLIEEK